MGTSTIHATRLGAAIGCLSFFLLATVGTSNGKEAAASPGAKLYAQHCAACHGEQGDGRGKAATFLYPRPRDFSSGKFRLLRTVNAVPTEADFEDVLLRGMPGSSMPPWGHLPAEQRTLLAKEALRLYQVGIGKKYAEELKKQDDLTDEELQSEETQAEIAAFVKKRTTPGELREVPELAETNAEAVGRGKALYVKQGCHACHGLEGKGDGVQKMLDDDGTPTRPRDLTRGIYKGGHDPVSLFRRMAVGMPGSPMPSSPNLTAEQIADLVYFLRSLSTEEQRQAAVLKREQIAVKKVGEYPRQVHDPIWKTIKAQSVALTPLWWRDDADPGLQVQAVHDGRVIAIRLSWIDTSNNASAIRPDEFEDAAALQFYKGSAEPFLGMGAEAAALDVWQWRAGQAKDGAEDNLMDEYPYDTPDYREKFLKGKEKGVPDFLTARAAGNPIVTRELGGGNLTSKGFGSLTFRPNVSQIVNAGGTWIDGRWTVVIARKLAVKPENGLSIKSGEKCSTAFAVWNGAARERGGQKTVSIWHDLVVE